MLIYLLTSWLAPHASYRRIGHLVNFDIAKFNEVYCRPENGHNNVDQKVLEQAFHNPVPQTPLYNLCSNLRLT